MSNDERIIELLSDMLVENRNLNKRMEYLEEKMTSGFDRLQEQQIKTNAAIGELRLSVLRLADEVSKFPEHEARLIRLEAEVFKS